MTTSAGNQTATEPPLAVDQFDPSTITRPDPQLMRYYTFCSLLFPPFSLLALLPLYIRYTTLRYRFDDDGIAVSWGFLLRKEVYLTYRRIQDIHLTRGIIQRWMGLASVSVQTASGNATPEVTIEGVLEAEKLRDYLYAKMRGARGDHRGEHLQIKLGQATAISESGSVAIGDGEVNQDELLGVLKDIRDNLQKANSNIRALVDHP